MAELGNVTLNVKPVLTVDLETARVCLKLVNWFLDANDRYRLSISNDGDGPVWVLTDRPIQRGAEDK